MKKKNKDDIKILIYTAIFGDYDTIQRVDTNRYPNVDYLCITNNNYEKVSNTKLYSPNYIKAKYFKFSAFKNYDVVVWLDGNYIITNIDELLKLCYQFYYTKKSSLWFRHDTSNSIYCEIANIIKNKENKYKTPLNEQRLRSVMLFGSEIKNIKFMVQSGIYMKKWNNKFNFILNKIYEKYKVVGRDQIIIPYTFDKYKYNNYEMVEGKIRHNFLRLVEHNRWF